MEVEKVFTKDEVAKRSYEKAEKFRRDQAAQLKYAEKKGEEKGEEKGIKAMVLILKELNVDKAVVIDKVSTHFHIQSSVAKGYVETNW